jgi:hypothetical protein
MGDVYACEDVFIGRHVAMKTLRFGVDVHDEGARSFVREAHLQARLEHPAIVPVYDVGTSPDGVPFFTMKRIAGTTLAQVLADRSSGDARWSLRRLLTAFVSVCLAVDYAHQQGVVHCDLKPGNIMLGASGEVHVLDWGSAQDAETHPGDGIVGTLGYMAPEQVSGGAVDAAADVYALGAILFEILMLTPLHTGVTRVALLKSTLGGVQGGPSLRGPMASLPPTLSDLVTRAVATRPSDRPASARALADGVDSYLDLALRLSRGRSASPHRRRRLAWATVHAAILALAASGCGGTGLTVPGPEPVESRDAGATSPGAGAGSHDGDSAGCVSATLTAWQFHDTAMPVCLDTTFSDHGGPTEFGYASIPPASDPGWTSYGSTTIDFSRPSRLCNTACSCLDGLDFDYWQAFLEVPAGLDVPGLVFTVSGVDDGALVTVFNATHPEGLVAPGSYISLGAPGVTTDLDSALTTGSNRIVLTHVDDCCSGSSIDGASLTLEGDGCAR